MPRRRSRPATLSDWPSTLRHLIRSAEVECPSGHAEALRELTTLALRKVPARGIFDPGARSEDDLFAAIESVANAHLQMTRARKEWRSALNAADLTLDRRDEIERAALHVQSVSDTAYFYAGLAFGLTSTCVYRMG